MGGYLTKAMATRKVTKNLPFINLFPSYGEVSLQNNRMKHEFCGPKRLSDLLKVTQFVVAKPELDLISRLPI